MIIDLTVILAEYDSAFNGGYSLSMEEQVPAFLDAFELLLEAGYHIDSRTYTRFLDLNSPAAKVYMENM